MVAKLKIIHEDLKAHIFSLVTLIDSTILCVAQETHYHVMRLVDTESRKCFCLRIRILTLYLSLPQNTLFPSSTTHSHSRFLYFRLTAYFIHLFSSQFQCLIVQINRTEFDWSRHVINQQLVN